MSGPIGDDGATAPLHPYAHKFLSAEDWQARYDAAVKARDVPAFMALGYTRGEALRALARHPPPDRAFKLLDAIGAKYRSTEDL